MNSAIIDFITGLFNNRVSDVIKTNDEHGFTFTVNYPDDVIDFTLLNRIRPSKEIVMFPMNTRSIDIRVQLDTSYSLPTNRLKLQKERAGSTVRSPENKTILVNELEQLWIDSCSEKMMLELPIKNNSLFVDRNTSGNVRIRGTAIYELCLGDLKTIYDSQTKQITVHVEPNDEVIASTEESKHQLVVSVTCNLANKKRRAQ